MKFLIFLNNHLMKLVLFCFFSAILAAVFKTNTLALVLGVAFGVTFLTGLILGVFMRVFYVKNRRMISKGKHYPDRIHFPYRINRGSIIRLSRSFIFNETAIYSFGDADDSDKNKLFGISRRILPVVKRKSWAKDKELMIWFSIPGFVVIKSHHWSSIRFAWNCYTLSTVRIYAYLYQEGKRVVHSEFLPNSLPLNKNIFCDLGFNKKTGVAHLMVRYDDRENIAIIEMKPQKSRVLYEYLDLYFGGNRKAPHAITIYEEKL